MEIITRTLDKEVVQEIAATIFMALHHHGVEPDNSYTADDRGFTVEAYKLPTGDYVIKYTNDGETCYSIVKDKEDAK
ncbi:MAG: hypothetical protein M0R06_01110 [Sphaerochaeta sp.]|jgi:hypothetical protein|nr:hypothetical protein [Sphaerochaeta sp.]